MPGEAMQIGSLAPTVFMNVPELQILVHMISSHFLSSQQTCLNAFIPISKALIPPNTRHTRPCTERSASQNSATEEWMSWVGEL